MKKTVAIGVAVLALGAGCPKRDRESPATAPTPEATSATPAAGEGSGPRDPRTGAGTVATTDDAGASGSNRAPSAATDAGADAGAKLEACVDAWLTANGFDRYGHPEGTMYTGGTPLFDERTGEQKDRMAYVFSRHEAARKACPHAARAAPDQPATR